MSSEASFVVRKSHFRTSEFFLPEDLVKAGDAADRYTLFFASWPFNVYVLLRLTALFQLGK